MEKGKLKYVVWDYTRLVQVFEVGLSSLPTLTPGCLEHLWSHDDDDEDLGLLQPALSANSATTSRGPPFFSEHHRRARDTHNSVGCQANKQSRLYLCQFKTAINLCRSAPSCLISPFGCETTAEWLSVLSVQFSRLTLNSCSHIVLKSVCVTVWF